MFNLQSQCLGQRQAADNASRVGKSRKHETWGGVKGDCFYSESCSFFFCSSMYLSKLVYSYDNNINDESDDKAIVLSIMLSMLSLLSFGFQKAVRILSSLYNPIVQYLSSFHTLPFIMKSFFYLFHISS